MIEKHDFVFGIVFSLRVYKSFDQCLYWMTSSKLLVNRNDLHLIRWPILDLQSPVKCKGKVMGSLIKLVSKYEH